MELWIRSQDKKIFEKCEDLFSAYYSSKKSYAICSHKNMITLGLYKTETRALEVLDKIQKCVVFSGVPHEQLLKEFIETKHDVFFNDLSQIVVYEMPEE